MSEKRWQDERKPIKPKEKKRGKGWVGFNGSEHPTHKKVLQTDMNGVEVALWDSLSIAAEQNQIDPSNLSKVCRGVGNRKSLKGFKWEFYEE